MKKKILYIHHSVGIGGASISLLELINCIDKERYDVEVLLLKDSIVGKILEDSNIKYSVAQLNFYKYIYRFFPHLEPEFFHWWQFLKISSFSIIWILSRFYFSSKLLSKHQFDILHLNSSVLTDFLAAGHARGKVVIHIREPVARGYFGFRRALIRNQIESYADWIIAISIDNLERLDCNSKSTVVYNFTEVKLNPSFNLPKDKIVLYLGGANEIKGFFTVVDALDYINSDVTIWFCGYYNRTKYHENNLIKMLYKIINKKSLIHRIQQGINKIANHPNAIVLGIRTDIPSLLNQCRILINPYTVEHFSRPIIESFANGRAVIATDVDGIEEIVNNGINGIIIKRNSAKELAFAINEMCLDDELCVKIARSGHAYALKNNTIKNIKKIEKIYDNISSNL